MFDDEEESQAGTVCGEMTLDHSVVQEVTSAVSACAYSKSGITQKGDTKAYETLDDPGLQPLVRSVASGLGVKVVMSLRTGNYYAVPETVESPFAVTISELKGSVLKRFRPAGGEEDARRLGWLIMTVMWLELVSALFDDNNPSDPVSDIRQADLFARVERRMGALRESGASVAPEERSPFYDGAVAYLEMKARDDDRPEDSRKKTTRMGFLNDFVTCLKANDLLRVEDGFVGATDYFLTVGREGMLDVRATDAYELVMFSEAGGASHA